MESSKETVESQGVQEQRGLDKGEQHSLVFTWERRGWERD